MNLGIQDAVALAAALRDDAGTQVALTSYEGLRRSFVERFQDYQLATPQLSGAGEGHPTLYGGIATLMNRGQPELDVT